MLTGIKNTIKMKKGHFILTICSYELTAKVTLIHLF